MKNAFLFYMDTLVEGAKVKDGAIAFVDYLIRKHHPFLILSEQNTRTRKQLCDYFQSLGFANLKEEHFYTTAMAAVDWIMSKEGTYKSITYIGGAGMKEAVNKSGLLIDYKDPDVVFVGMNRELGYKDYCDILQYISGRSLFISTDNRKTQRYDGMMMIGNGSIVKMLEYASNKEAISFGRGSVMTIHLAMRHLKSYVEDAIFVSHRFQDDLLTASIAGMETTLITEGKDIYSLGVSKDYYPTSIADSLEGLTINASLR